MAGIDRTRLEELAHKWLKGTLNRTEQQEFDSWFSEFNDEPLEITSASGSDEELEAALFKRIRQATAVQPERKVRTLWPRIAAAASILIALSFGGYFILHKQKAEQVALLKPGTFRNDVMPGDKAFLTLSNGKKIAVSSAKTGPIAQQGLVNIQKNSNGNLVYQSTQAENSSTAIEYNTFTTLRGGGKHSLTLADGTLAVLDAGSSITYPASFSGTERQVEITGQVYFEVVHRAKMPFSVKVKNQIIRDLGTHFNINAYDDEGDVKTTLLEGSIAIKNCTLKPGQQAVTSPDGAITIKNNVNTDIVIAWKNDLFKFDSNTSLAAVMRQLSRWYDLDVVYQGEKKHYNFGGDIPRNSKLSDVLKILTYSGVHFAVDGKKIIVFQ